MDTETILQLFEVFLAGWEAHRTGKKNPAEAFDDYLAVFTAGESDFVQ